MSILADISTGHSGAADVAFLVAVILAVLAALLGWFGPTLPDTRRVPIGWLAVAAIALGLLLL